MTFRGRLLAALVVAVTLVGACSGDDSDDGDPGTTEAVETSESSTSSTDTSSSTTDPDAAVEAEVEAAYMAYVDAFVEIFAKPDPASPLIERHTTGASREKTLDAVSQHIADGTAIQLPADDRDFEATVRRVRVNGTSAIADVCFIDGGLLVENATGAVLNDALVTLKIEAVLVLDGGQWKVSEHETLERHEGRVPCSD